MPQAGCPTCGFTVLYRGQAVAGKVGAIKRRKKGLNRGPKPPMSPLHLFQRDFKDQNPNCGARFMSSCAQAWNGLDPEIKEKYKKTYAEAKAAHEKELEKFHAQQDDGAQAASKHDEDPPPEDRADAAPSSPDSELEL